LKEKKNSRDVFPIKALALLSCIFPVLTTATLLRNTWSRRPYIYCQFSFIDGQHTDVGISDSSAITGDNSRHIYIHTQWIQYSANFFFSHFFEDKKALYDFWTMRNSMENTVSPAPGSRHFFGSWGIILSYVLTTLPHSAM